MIQFKTLVGSRLFDIHPDETGIFQYPAGEFDFHVFADGWIGDQYAIITGQVDPQDYITLRMWARMVRNQGGFPTAVIPYLPGGRGDKGVTQNSSIYADMINAAGVPVITFDAHSEKTMGFYHNLTNVLSSTIAHKLDETMYEGIIAPDEGAIDRAACMGAEMNLPVYNAVKKRDLDSGKILSIEAPSLPYDIGRYLVVDDICDGGGTFLGLADEIRKTTFIGKLDLFVSHGIFSKGTDKLYAKFDRIYSTDSFPELIGGEFTKIPVINDMIIDNRLSK